MSHFAPRKAKMNGHYGQEDQEEKFGLSVHRRGHNNHSSFDSLDQLPPGAQTPIRAGEIPLEDYASPGYHFATARSSLCPESFDSRSASPSPVITVPTHSLIMHIKLSQISRSPVSAQSAASKSPESCSSRQCLPVSVVCQRLGPVRIDCSHSQA